MKIQRWLRYFYRVPWCVPAWGWNEFYAIISCIFSGHISRGPYIERFSNAISEYLSIPYIILVNKGRYAIEVALVAIGVGKNDDVVVPLYICQSVIEAIERTDAHPVFCDIGPDLHMTEESVKDAITQNTKCVIVPHIFSNTAPIDRIEKFLKGSGIRLIDDAAQLIGSKCSGRLIGTFGDFGIISCGAAKAIAAPAGGALVTRNKALYNKAKSVTLGQENSTRIIFRFISFLMLRRFRKCVLPFRVIFERIFGTKEDIAISRCEMSNLDAAIAHKQLLFLEKNYLRRKQNSEIIVGILGDLWEMNNYVVKPDSEILKVVVVLSRNAPSSDRIIAMLGTVGIECQKGYIPSLQDGGDVLGTLPYTEELWDRVVCIPIDTRFAGPRISLRLVGGDFRFMPR